MRITIAKTAGFCMGVRRAVDMVLDEANKTLEPICTYGPLIHNPQVLKMLEEKGIPAVNSIPLKGEGTVLIRAHGVPPHEQKALAEAGFKVINATCPRVIRVQTIIRKHSKKGFSVIIVGDRDHPEVKGLMGYAEKGCTVSGIKELSELPQFEKAIVVAQTTQDTVLYDSLKQWISSSYPHYKIFDTICDSTEKRQTETRRIAEISDAVIIVGGKESGNTRRLAQIALETVLNRTDYNENQNRTSAAELNNKNTADNSNSNKGFAVHIEDVSQLTQEDMKHLVSAESIAITAGASTPNWTISQTYRAIENAIQKDKKNFSAVTLRIRDFLLKSNFLLSAGAGSLTYACSKMQGIDHNLIYAFISMLYVLSMQILNNLFSIKSDKYNNPERAEFYEKNKIVLALTAVFSGGAGLFLSFAVGFMQFLILSFMSMLGLLYNQKIFPEFLPKFYILGRKIGKIKDIPGSKTILIAAAWGTVTSLLPAISTIPEMSAVPAASSPFISFSSPDLSASTNTIFFLSRNFIFIIPFIFSTSLLFARTAFFAVLEIQGDRITGKETIPIILGEKKSLKLIQNMLIFAALIILLSSLIGFIPIFSMMIALVPLLMLYIIKSHKKGTIHNGTYLEFIIESNLILTGIIAAFFK